MTNHGRRAVATCAAMCDVTSEGASRSSRRRERRANASRFRQPVHIATHAPFPDVAARAIQPPDACVVTAASDRFIGDDAEACAEFLQRLGAADEDGRSQLVEVLASQSLDLSTSKHGCRVIQKAIEICGAANRDKLIKTLEPHVPLLFQSPHGNHVLGKMIEVVPPATVSFVIDSMVGQATFVARHRYGCRIIERLIEHCDEQNQLAPLLDELEFHAEPLARHPFANFVIQHILEHCSAGRRGGIARRLLPHLPMLAVHRTASHVVQRALDYSDEETKFVLMGALLEAASPYSIEEMATSRYGSYVVEQLATQSIHYEQLRWRLARAIVHLTSSHYGQLVADKFKLAAPVLQDVQVTPSS